MPQKSIRFPTNIATAIEAQAEHADRSFSWLVIEACRAAYTPTATRATTPHAQSAPRASDRANRTIPDTQERTAPATRHTRTAEAGNSTTGDGTGTPLPKIAERRRQW